MRLRRRVFPLVLLLVLASSIAPFAQNKDEKKRDDAQKKDDKKKSDFAYEDISFVPVQPGQTSTKIARSFTVPAGSYEVFLVAKEPTPDKAPKNAPPPKASVLKRSIDVPDFWNGELN